MRMDRSAPTTARDLLDRLSHGELARLLRDLGEVECPGRVARVLLENRHGLRTTGDLARLVGDVLPGSLKARMKIHPATKVFLALRIAVNDELSLLERALPLMVDRLAPGGRIVVISFHSLEDRVVKRFLVSEAKGCVCPTLIPLCVCRRKPRLAIATRRPIEPRPAEIASNPRSRSARMRIGVRL
jgi:16S rRNA (cytosine1402-N4)-methyltransferase